MHHFGNVYLWVAGLAFAAWAARRVRQFFVTQIAHAEEAEDDGPFVF